MFKQIDTKTCYQSVTLKLLFLAVFKNFIVNYELRRERFSVKRIENGVELCVIEGLILQKQHLLTLGHTKI